MALFKSNPDKAVQRDIDAAVANRDRLSAKLAEFDQAVARHAAAAKEFALSGDDAELDRAEGSLRASQDRSATLKTALAEVEQQLVALERAKAEMSDRKLRAETAAEIELLVRKMTDFAAEFDAAAASLSEYTARAVPVIWEARGLDEFVKICRAQVPSTVEMVGTLLRAHADAVVAGTASATLPRPDEPIPAQVPVAAPVAQEPPFKYHVLKGGPAYKGPVPKAF
jgi:chromosome segregation ATPase